jgi:hypothetical protein
VKIAIALTVAGFAAGFAVVVGSRTSREGA